MENNNIVDQVSLLDYNGNISGTEMNYAQNVDIEKG